MDAFTLSCVSRCIMQSPMPTLNPRTCMNSTSMRCASLMKFAATLLPKSFTSTWMMPPADVPMLFLHSEPAHSTPRRITTHRSCMSSTPSFSSSTPSDVPLRTTICSENTGSSSENSCLPVHRGRGFSTAGGGRFSCPGMRGSTNSGYLMGITICMICSRVKKVSLSVSSITATSESCTSPMIGLLDCGEISCVRTHISSCASATASTVRNTCRFISSPSKSALYGVVSQTGRRNVLSWMMRT